MATTVLQTLLKGLKFLVNQIKDGINPRQTCNLIYSLTRWDQQLARQIVTAIFQNIIKATSNLHCQVRYNTIMLHYFDIISKQEWLWLNS